ncbi:Mechanosensitive ion channel protein 10-like protein [Drosera capensis]
MESKFDDWQGSGLRMPTKFLNNRDLEQVTIQIPTRTLTFAENSKFSPSPCLNPSPIPVSRTLTHRLTFKSRPKSRFGDPPLTLDSIESAVSLDQLFGSSFKEASATNTYRTSNKRLKQLPLEKERQRKGQMRRRCTERVTAQLSARDKKRLTVKLVIELAVFFSLLGCLICSLSIKRFKGFAIHGSEIWKWFLLLLAIFSGMLVTHWIAHVVVFIIEWKFLLKKNVVYFTHGLKTSVEVFIWLGLILATWGLLIKPDIDHPRRTRNALDFITWTLVCLLLGAFLCLIKTIMLKILASSFHLNRFFERIQESIFYHYVLQMLSGRPMWSCPVIESLSGRVSFTGNAQTGKKKKVVDMEKLYQMKQEKVPNWTMQLLVDVASNTGLSTLSGMLEEDMVEGGVELDDDEITSEEQAIATAVRIFENIVTDKDEQSYIGRSDLHRFLISEEIDLLFPMFEANEKGQISLKAFSKWVVKVFRDRQALKHALNDNKTAVKQIDKLVTGILIVIMFVVWLLLTEILTTKVLLFFSSQLVVAAFMFENTCKTIFEAIIFVFVTHPFDVGDRCSIEGTMMVVEEMNIFTTVFLGRDNVKVYYPNSILATKAIGNFYRSPDQVDTLDFSIDYKTPLSKIGDLKDRVRKYERAKPACSCHSLATLKAPGLLPV